MSHSAIVLVNDGSATRSKGIGGKGLDVEVAVIG